MKSTDFLNTSALRSLRMASIGNEKIKNKKVVMGGFLLTVVVICHF